MSHLTSDSRDSGHQAIQGMGEVVTAAPPSNNMSSMSELFELLDRLQSSRLDDQRCEMPSMSLPRQKTQGATSGVSTHNERHGPCRHRLEQVLAAASPYPQVVVEGSSYWVDPSDQDTLNSIPWKAILMACLAINIILSISGFLALYGFLEVGENFN